MKKAFAAMLMAILICSVLAVPSALAAGEDWVLTDVIPGGGYYFNTPYDVATDAAGNIYVTDTYNHRIKKYTPEGSLDTSWAGAGILGGVKGSGADEFDGPVAIVVDASGNLYVADTGNDRVKRYNASGILDVGWGSGGVVDGFDMPCGVAVDGSGNLYVADSGNDCIKRYNSFGILDTAWGSGGSIGSLGNGPDELNYPCGLAIDTSSAKLYVADGFNHRIVRYNLDGTLDTAWGSGGMIGTGSRGSNVNEFDQPVDVDVDTSGSLFVTDTFNHRIKKYTPGGILDTSWGSNGIIGSNGDGAENFYSAWGLAVDSSGNLYVADTGNSRIKKYKSNSELDTAWCAGGIMAAFGRGAGQFYSPSTPVMDSRGRIYVADTFNKRIARYTSSGALDTAWGSGGYIGSVDDDAFLVPQYVAVDSDDNLYVSDSNNKRIKRYTSAGVLDTSWATGGILSDDLIQPTGIDIDDSGNLYVADLSRHCINRYTPGGVRDTSWGGGDGMIGTGSSGNGTDEFYLPRGLAVMPDGTLFVSDAGNHRVKAYTPQGELKTSWGGGDGIVVGSAELGTFSSPYDLTVNSDTGEVYVADTLNGRVIGISPDGTNQECIWQPDGTLDDTGKSFGIPYGIDYFAGRLAIVSATSHNMALLTNVTDGVKLGDLTVFGETVSGFDPDTHEYTVVVSKNATQVKIDATPKDIFSSVSGTGTFTLNANGSTQRRITVTAAVEGYSDDYTLNVLRSGEDVGLKSLTVDGGAVSGFREDDTSYTITAPYGARYVDIGAVGNSYCEEIMGAGVVKLTDNSTTFSVIAKAKDGSAKEYTLTVKKGSSEATTFKLTADGEIISSGGMSIVVPEDGRTVMLRVKLSNGKYADFPLSLTLQSGENDTEPSGEQEMIPDTGDASDTDEPFTLSLDGAVISADAQLVIPEGGKTTVITIEMPDGSVYEIPIEFIPEASADSAVDVNAYDIGGAVSFAWWWIAIGVLALALAGAGVWVYLLKKSIS